MQNVQAYSQGVLTIELIIWKKTNFSIIAFEEPKNTLARKIFLAHLAIIVPETLEIIVRKTKRRLHHHKEIDRIETYLMEEHDVEQVKLHCNSCSRTPYLYSQVCRICKKRAKAWCAHHLSSSNNTVCNLSNHNCVVHRRFTSARVKQDILKGTGLARTVHEKVLQWNETIINKTIRELVRNKHSAAQNAEHGYNHKKANKFAIL